MPHSFDQRLAGSYDALSAKLRQAGDYVAANPIDVATRSLRAVSADSGLAPATFSRLARALDFENFEALRDSMRSKLGRRMNGFADRAGRLQQEHGGEGGSFVAAHLRACLENVEQMGREIDTDLLERVVDQLHGSRKVVALGGLGSTGPVEYLSYMANFCADNWSLASRMGASLGAGLTGLDERDALIIVTMPPFSARSISAARMAAAQGVYVIVITDTHACPALRHAAAHFIMPTDSPHFYSSYVATLALIETMIGMLAARAGNAARERIAEVEESNRRLEETWPG
ncbi:MurR/RpiR family transcriptional regulator [Pseudoruegeria sp. HB172150]|uniref:MurR/RpiR family transcriptional regulator n=1 Tax=Pseudoruegeria sp. HB172150 TaxID=2721164 RepID=UPI0020A6C40D|nr:MurR/RpiR family transcriptional regulator [Pseudoruegeria sp. HB172150]